MSAARLTARRRAIALVALGGLTVACAAVAASIGSVSIDLGAALFGDPEGVDAVILFRARLPRIALALAVGGGLGASGAALQALLRNPLASPDVIGVSGGASVGAITALALGAGEGALGWLAIAGSGFVGALATIVLIVRVATVAGRLNPYHLLLVGVILNTIASAAILFVNSLLDFYRAHGILFWLTGSLGQRSWPVIGLLALGAATGLIVLQRRASALNVLALGDEGARSLGADVDGVRRSTFLAAALLVGASVSVSGIIGFVGLIVPHVLRLLLGPDLRLLVPASFLGGGAFLVAADTVARVALAPTEIPVGVITALAGGPFFVALLRRRGRPGA